MNRAPHVRRAAGALAAVALLAALAAAPGQAKTKLTPQTDRSLGPTANAGHFLGYPTPDYEWHGCKHSDTQWWPVSLVSGQQTTSPSTSHYVTFRTDTAAFPLVTWKAKAGYRICGVEAAVELTNPTVDSDLLAEAAYTSGPLDGTTAPNGRETIPVRIPLKGIGRAGFEKFEGKTFSIYRFQAVTVFVRKG